MEVNVLNIKGEDTGKKVALNEAIFGITPNDHAIYLDVKQYMANQRQGTHKSKERSEISGSTRKLGRQKGGGGARRGDINSPVLVGGARVFGPKPRDYWFKLNTVIFSGIMSDDCLRAFGTDSGQLRTFFDFNSPSLIIGQMPMKTVDIV